MKSVTISTYMMRVKNSRKDAEYYYLNNLPPGKSLFELLADYLDQLGEEPSNDTDNQFLLRASHIKKNGQSISGILERGEYGIKSALLDVKKREISYERSVSDAEMMPFYFLAVVPLEGTQALIAFEVEGNSGIKTQFEDDFEAFIQQKCKECDLEIERLVPEKLINQYFKKGRVTKLRFVRFRVPTDIADAVKLGIAEQGTTMELQVRAKRGTTFSIGRSIQDILHGNLDAKDFVQIKGFEFDTVKIEFDMDGKRRTMDLAAPNSFRADYNVTEKVDMYGGHPRYNSIDKIAREIVREIMRSLRLEAEGV